MRATSINFIPLVCKVRTGTGTEDRPGLHVIEWELLEWGPVGIPDNPYAVAKALNRGKLDGSAIDPMILRMLKAHAPELKKYGKGFEMDEEEKKAADAKKAAEQKAADDAAAAATKPADKIADKPSTDGQGEQTADGEDAPAIPHGSKAMAAMHKALTGIMHKCMKAAGSLEPDSQAKDHLDGLADSLGGHVADLVSAHKKCYKDLPSLDETYKKDMDGDDDSDSKSFAKFLADGQNARLQLTGVMARLKSFVGDKNLNAEQKSAIEAAATRVTALVEQARKQGGATEKKSAASGGFSTETVKALEGVTKMFGDLKQQIADAIPHK